jgi:hypothetical protein
VFTARYGLVLYIKQICFFFKRLNNLGHLEDILFKCFQLLGYDFSVKPEHVASNKGDVLLVVAGGLNSPFVLLLYRIGMPLLKVCPINRFINFHYMSLFIDWATDRVGEESWFESRLGAMESSVFHNFTPALGPIQWVPAVCPRT